MLDGHEMVPRCQRALLKGSHFYISANGAVYDAIVALHASGQPTDAACVAEAIKRAGQLDAIGGFDFLARVSSRIPTTAQAGYFLDIVVELAILRRIIREGTAIVEDCYGFSGDLVAFTGAVASKIQAIADYALGRTRRVTQREAAAAATQEALDVAAGRIDKSRWLHWPWPRVDAEFLPVDTRQEDWLNLIAAPPSGGKSSILRALAAHWLQNGKRGVVFLLETSRKRWLQALAASFAGVNLRQLEDTRVLFPKRFQEFEEWMRVIEGWMEERLWVFDDVVALEDITRITRELHRTQREREITAGVAAEDAHGLDFVVGDYLQIVTVRRQFLKRTEELAHICRALKQLHRGLDVPGFWGAQITREARNEGRRPTLADLGESKALEENADRVGFLHVPSSDDTPPQEAGVGLVEIIQRKSRNGPKDVALDLTFDRPLNRFYDASRKLPVASSGPLGVNRAAKLRKEDFQ